MIKNAQHETDNKRASNSYLQLRPLVRLDTRGKGEVSIVPKPIGNALGRVLWGNEHSTWPARVTHEYANKEALQAEFEGKVAAPTFEDILKMIPSDKVIIIDAEL